jgi:DinB superfamily
VHARTTELLDHLARQRALLRRAVEDVPPHRRDARPAPDRWSVANILEHLAIVEGRVASGLAQRLAAERARLPPASDATSVVRAADMDRYLDRGRPIASSETSWPAANLPSDAAWEAAERAREATCALVLDADGLSVDTVVAPHPALGSLNMHQWVVFLGGHDARHALQIQEVGLALSSNAPQSAGGRRGSGG